MENQNKPAFYFSTNEKKLRYNDGRSIVVGETHSVDGEIDLCKKGLHASERLIDALPYASGNILYLVECSGDIDATGDDKFCSRHRKYLAEFDATKVLQEFSRKVTLINVELIKPYCSEDDYKIILYFLETGNNAADAAAADVVWSSIATRAAWAADAVTQATYTVTHAAWSTRAAYATAYAATHAAGADWHANKDVQNDLLTSMIKEATGWDI